MFNVCCHPTLFVKFPFGLYVSKAILIVDEITVPYFSKQKAKLGLPETQKPIWQIDVWSVHRSKEFHDWMKAHHLNIIPDFVWQACDVGMQGVPSNTR